MCIPCRVVELRKAAVLLLAADQAVIDLDSDDRALIAKVLDGHALKA